MSTTKSVADLIERKLLVQLAVPSNIRAGEEIIRNDGVEITEMTSKKVVAIVNSTETRTVQLRSNGKELSWECTCSSDHEILCKHGVAAALAAWQKSTQKKSH
jgi:uncharacterized Zn finger protein